MSADALTPVRAGDRLKISASAWNAVTSLVKRDRQGSPSESRRDPLGWGGVIEALALNDTGTDLREYRPVTITDVGGYELPVNDSKWQRNPLFTIDAPSAETDFVAVTLEAIPDGQIGRIAIAGAVQCDVAIASDAHRFAEPIAGDTDKLQSVAAGPIRILHVTAVGGSTFRCVVMLAGGGSSATDSNGDGIDDDTGNGPGNLTDAIGIPLLCEVQNEYGGTGVLNIVQTRPDGSLRCVPIPPCCPSRWYCVRSGPVEGLCCDGETVFKWTKYLKVNFTEKTGAAEELPDAAIWVYETSSGGYGYGEGGGFRWSGGSGSYRLGRGNVSGGLVFDCEVEDGYGDDEGEDDPEIESVPEVGSLFAALDLTGFEPEEDTSVEVPCEAGEGAIDLGYFTYTETTSNRCGGTTTRTGRVRVSFEPWKEDGVVEIGPGVVPPWDKEAGPFKSEEEAAACCPVTLPCFDGQTFEMPSIVHLDFLEVTDRQNGATGWPFGLTGFGTLTVPNTIPLVFNGTGWKFEVPSGAVCGDQFPFVENDNSGASCGTYSFGVDCVSGVSKTAVAAGANGVSPSQTFAADDADPFFDTSASTTTPGWRFRLTLIPSAGPPASLVVTFLVSHPTLGSGVREWFKPATDPLKSPTDSGGLPFEANVFVNVALGKSWKVRGRVRW